VKSRAKRGRAEPNATRFDAARIGAGWKAAVPRAIIQERMEGFAVDGEAGVGVSDEPLARRFGCRWVKRGGE
jgi:hypothetical protein